MHSSLKNLADSLDKLESEISNSKKHSDTFAEQNGNGWNHLSIRPIDLVDLPYSISLKIKDCKIDELDENLKDEIDRIPDNIDNFIVHTLPYLFNGNHTVALPIFFNLIQWINSVLDPLFSWQSLKDQKLLPSQLVKRLNAIDAELTDLIPNKDSLSEQIQKINEATEAADNLPINLQSLKENKLKVEKITEESTILKGKIENFHSNSETMDAFIKEKQEQIIRLLAECEDAYQITTTKGLAASFELRAISLTRSMYLWVGGLLLALVAGGWIGSMRFDSVHDAIKEKEDPAFVWIQIFLSLISFGAPIWLAWISTKQISQRFKLSEDYAFKASIAKAYQGYKKEAAIIDEKMAGRLFGSALERLEEAPLRLMEEKHYSSPWQELLNSKAVKKALDAAPEAKNDIMDILKKLATPEPKVTAKKVNKINENTADLNKS